MLQCNLSLSSKRFVVRERTNLRQDACNTKFHLATDTGKRDGCVQVTGVTRCKPDVFATSALLKVNALPYLFHPYLMHVAEDAKTVAAITDQGVTFTLTKVGDLPCCLLLST